LINPSTNISIQILCWTYAFLWLRLLPAFFHHFVISFLIAMVSLTTTTSHQFFRILINGGYLAHNLTVPILPAVYHTTVQLKEHHSAVKFLVAIKVSITIYPLLFQILVGTDKYRNKAAHLSGLQVLQDNQMSRVAKFILRMQFVKMKAGLLINNHMPGLSQDRHLNYLITSTVTLGGMRPLGFNECRHIIIAAETCIETNHRIIMRLIPLPGYGNGQLLVMFTGFTMIYRPNSPLLSAIADRQAADAQQCQ